ncbi:MAG: hypothetical protein MJE77_10255 [Proteobacteria bacterium]|nr:hypothetical protein [Pseudomonadota bacterium]
MATMGAVGCFDAVEPDVGPPLHDFCQNEDSDPSRDVEFTRDIVRGIFVDSNIACYDCHTADGRTPLGLEVGGLDLSSYSGLRSGGAVGGPDLVVVGRPCESILVQKISAGPPFGSRMPLDGPPFLDNEQRQLIIDWIAEGARDN